MPDGAHQVVLSSQPFFPVLWRAGLSERLNYVFPLGLSYRLPGDASESLLMLVACGAGVYEREVPAQDPRHLDDRETAWVVVGCATLAHKRRFAASALTVALNHQPQLHSGGVRWLPLSGHAAVTWDPSSWLSLSLGVATGTTALESTPEGPAASDLQPWIGVGGVGFDGVSIPVVSVHVADWVDLLGSPLAFYDLNAGTVDYGASFGIDLHFD